ncbi:pyridoxal phosphate phosphatase PHOSPHO2-like protein, partial [Leptotrombidium deliense]
MKVAFNSYLFVFGIWTSKEMSETPNAKHLVIFDFDYSIVDCNSDTFVNSLCPDSIVPERVNKEYDGNNWTQYMAELFKYLHECGVRRDDYEKCLVKMPFVKGLNDLILNLKPKNNADDDDSCGEDEYELIIISDSNSFFIETFLEYNGMENVFRKVYTNPASFDTDGCLIINEYQRQTFCNISAVNICKGHVLQEY